MTKKLRSIAVATLLATLLAPMTTGCKKSAASMSHDEKVATLDEPGRLLARSWKLDVNASAAANSKAVEKASGIKSDVKFAGDVGKVAQFAAKSYLFGFEKSSLELVFEEKYGEGILSTASTGYWKLSADGKTLELRGAGKQSGKDRSYKVAELDATHLVLVPTDGGAIEVFQAK